MHDTTAMNEKIDIDDLTDEQIEQVINTRLFQKGLAYRKLAEGIDVLEDEDEIYDSLVTSIQKQHGSVSTESSIREVLRLFREEVETFTEPLVTDGDEEIDAPELEDIYVNEGGQV